VAVSGDTVAVGARQEDSSDTGVDGNQADNSAGNSGAAYVFSRNGSVWSQQAYLKASNTNAGDQFAHSLAASGDTVVIGAPSENSIASDSGAVYAFIRNGTTWSQQAYLKASNADVLDQFGHSVAASGDMVAVGAWTEDSSASGVNGNQTDNSFVNAGAAYSFTGVGPDADGDGVPDLADACPNNAPSVPVDCQGRPRADFDGDCDVDLADFAEFQLDVTGPNP
jgi:hypothetical protein